MLVRLAARSSTRVGQAPALATTTINNSSRSSLRASVVAAAAMSAAAAAAPSRPSASLPPPVGAPKGAQQGALSLDPSCYPPCRRDAAAGDALHGVFCPDPYRHLEDPDAEETRAFVDAQNAVADKVLKGEAVSRVRAPFRALFERLYDYPRFSTPFKRGDAYYYYHNSGLQPQSILYRAGADPTAPHERSAVFLDPNTPSDDGTVALRDVSFSEDGKLCAYSLSDGGSDWSVIKVMRAADDEGEGGGGAKCGDALPDVLRRVKFSSIAWTADGLGFFYCRYDVGAAGAEGGKAEAAAAAAGPPDAEDGGGKGEGEGKEGGKAYDGTEVERLSGQRLYYHVLGDAQDKDVLVWEDPEQPDWMWGAECTEDG
jgi:prolyl oligopeptidase